MRHLRVGLLMAASIGLLSMAAPVSAQVVSTPDGHYYRLVPVKRHGAAAEMVNVIPGQATANVAPAGACEMDTWLAGGQYQGQHVTYCRW